METVIAFLAGFLLNWWALGFLLFAGVLFEYNEAHGSAIFIGFVAAAVSYFFFDVALATIGLYSIAYFVIGVVWSFWRYKRHADKVVKESVVKDSYDRERALKRLHPSEMLGKLTTWILVWPFSMIENLVGDIINVVQRTITTVLKNAYMAIYNSAAGKLSDK
jgi:hypothetical protein